MTGPEKAALPQAPRFFEAFTDTRQDVHLHGRYFTYRNSQGLVAGATVNVSFAVAKPVSQVWPYYKNFNLWQPHHYYTGVVGDLEGKTFGISDRRDDSNIEHIYQVIRVIPEHLIVFFQPPAKEGTDTGLPGLGIVSPGFMVFMLEERNGGSVANILMEHASLMERFQATPKMTEEDALQPWRDPKMVPEWLRKWRDDFIPAFKAVIQKSEK
jgi:hypothetical protein